MKGFLIGLGLGLMFGYQAAIVHAMLTFKTIPVDDD